MKKLVFSLIYLFTLAFITFAQKQKKVSIDTPYVRVIPTKNLQAPKVTKESVVAIVVKQYLDTLLVRANEQQLVYPSERDNEFVNMNEGDNIFFVIPVANLIKDSSLYKDFITRIEIVKVYKNQQSVDTTTLLKEPTVKLSNEEDFKIRQFLQEREIEATKLPNGTYLEMIEQGSGNRVGNKPVEITVRYRGVLMDNGVVFHQNMKPNQSPLVYTTDQYEFLPVCEEVLKTMKKGDHIRLYIPSSQAFGKKYIPNVLPPYSNLIYELVLEDIKPISKVNNKKK